MVSRDICSVVSGVLRVGVGNGIDDVGGVECLRRKDVLRIHSAVDRKGSGFGKYLNVLN
jgi:hypothetical protein